MRCCSRNRTIAWVEINRPCAIAPTGKENLTNRSRLFFGHLFILLYFVILAEYVTNFISSPLIEQNNALNYNQKSAQSLSVISTQPYKNLSVNTSLHRIYQLLFKHSGIAFHTGLGAGLSQSAKMDPRPQPKEELLEATAFQDCVLAGRLCSIFGNFTRLAFREGTSSWRFTRCHRCRRLFAHFCCKF